MTEKLKVVTLIDYSSRPSGKFYGYKYYIQFEPLHELLTNNKRFFETLTEGQTYDIEYQPIIPARCIAPNTASIMIDMKNPKIKG